MSIRGCKRTTSEQIGSTSHVTLLSGRLFLICDTRHRPRATSPIDPVRMMRIEGDEGNILEVAVSITKLLETFAKRLLLPPPKNSGGSGSNFHPQNTQCMSACPACPVAPADGTGVANSICADSHVSEK